MSHSNYAIRLDLVCKVEGIDSAEKYFSSLPDPAKNLLTYGCLLNCYCMERREDEAIAFFEMMKEKDLVSNCLPYDNMMSLYMRIGKPEKVPLLIEEMAVKKIAPSEFSYSILMNSYAAVKDIDAVEKTFKKMESSGIMKPKWPSYTNLASLYVAAGNLEKAESALKKAEGKIDRGDRQCFHFLITLYAGLGKLDEVNRVWSALKAAFPSTLNMSYLTMMQSLSKMEKLDLLEKCYHEWESECVAYDIRLVNILVGAYLRKDMINEADELLKKVEEFGCKPDFRTLEMYIDYYIGKKEMGRAQQCMEAAISKSEGTGREWKPNKAKVDAFLKHFEETSVVGMEEFLEKLKNLEVE